MKISGFIDAPEFLEPLETWEAFAAEMETIADHDPQAAAELRRARRIIAQKKAEAARAAS